MPTFVSKSGETQHHHKTTTRYTKAGPINLDADGKEILDSTGLPMTVHSTNLAEIISSGAAPGFNEFAGMSNERKKDMLHARAKTDFKKNIAPVKEQMLKDVYGR